MVLKPKRRLVTAVLSRSRSIRTQRTTSSFCQVLKKQGVEQYNPVGDKFDPNLHNALFEVPDGDKAAGIVAIATKVTENGNER